MNIRHVATQLYCSYIKSDHHWMFCLTFSRLQVALLQSRLLLWIRFVVLIPLLLDL